MAEHIDQLRDGMDDLWKSLNEDRRAATAMDLRINAMEDFLMNEKAESKDHPKTNLDISLREKAKGVGTLSQSAKVELLLNGHESLVVHFTYNHVMERTHDGGFFKLENGEVNENFDIYLTCGQGIYGSCTKLRLIFHLKKLTVWMRKDLPYKADFLPHLYTLIVCPDSTYEVRIDNKKEESGKLDEDWDFLAPKKLSDPGASKPEGWDDRTKLDDPEDRKPEDWDKAKYIPHPEAKKPEDWDDEMDGEWEPPMIDNPEYKGKWKPKQIPNPAYKGPWVQPQIRSCEYALQDLLKRYVDVFALGVDQWQEESGTVLDNFLVTHNDKLAEDTAKEILDGIREGEGKKRDEKEEERKKREEEEERKKREEEQEERKKREEEEERKKREEEQEERKKREEEEERKKREEELEEWKKPEEEQERKKREEELEEWKKPEEEEERKKREEEQEELKKREEEQERKKREEEQEERKKREEEEERKKREEEQEERKKREEEEERKKREEEQEERKKREEEQERKKREEEEKGTGGKTETKEPLTSFFLFVIETCIEHAAAGGEVEDVLLISEQLWENVSSAKKGSYDSRVASINLKMMRMEKLAKKSKGSEAVKEKSSLSGDKQRGRKRKADVLSDFHLFCIDKCIEHSRDGGEVDDALLFMGKLWEELSPEKRTSCGDRAAAIGAKKMRLQKLTA